MSRTLGILLLGIITVILATNIAHAQPATWEFGVKGGLTDSRLRGSQVSLFISEPGVSIGGAVGNYTRGFTGGVYIRRYFSDFVALQVEAAYVEKGGEGPIYGTIDIDVPNVGVFPADVDAMATISLDYMEVPVLAVFTFPHDDDSKVILTASGGAYFAVKTRSEVNLEGTAVAKWVDNSNRTFRLGETYELTNVKRYDIGGIVGIGVEVATGNVRILFDGRYEFGLVNLDDTGQTDVWNNTFSLTAGVGFPLGD